MTQEPGPASASIASGHSERRLNFEFDKLERVDTEEREKKPGGILSSCYCSLISPFFIFCLQKCIRLLYLMQSQLAVFQVSCVTWQLKLYVVPTIVYSRQEILCQKSELQLMVEIRLKTL